MIRDVMQSNVLYAHSIWAVGAGMAASAVGGFVLLEFAVSWLVAREVRRRHNELTAAMFSIVGVTYAVLLAFVAMLAWDNYNTAKAATEREAAQVFDVVQLAGGVEGSARDVLGNDLRAYVDAVRDVEWPAQASGRPSSAGEKDLRAIRESILALRPDSASATNVQAALLRSVADLDDARRMRVSASVSGIPSVVWFVVVAGGAISLLFAALLGTSSRGLHMVVGALLALSGSLVLIMIVALGHPFRGDFRITSDAFGTAAASMSTN